MYRIYLEHGEAYGNLGDEAMLVNAARRLRREFGEVEFVVPVVEGAPLPDIAPIRRVPSARSAVQGVMRRLLPVQRVRAGLHRLPYDPLAMLTPGILRRIGGGRTWRKLVAHLERCDGVYFVGAANLNDFARLGCIVPKYALLQQARALGKPVVVSSQTVGPLEIPWARRMVRRMVSQSTFFSVRDGGISKEVLAGLGADPRRIPFTGDEAFTLPPAPAEKAGVYLERNGVSADEPFALIHFRATDYTRSTRDYYPKIAAALDAADVTARICFLPMSYWTHSGRDEECGRAIRDCMRRPEKLVVLRSSRDVQLVRALFDMAAWAVGLSYHLQVFALAAACPLALLASGEYYETKARGMQQLVGGATPLHRIDTARSSALADTMADLDARRSHYVDQLRAVVSRVEERADDPVRAMAAAVS